MHYFCLFVVCFAYASSNLILNKPTEYLDVYLEELNLLLTEILYSTQVHRCYAIITDNIHYTAFGSTFFERSLKSYSNFFLRISDFEDLMAPNFQTVRVLKEIRAQNCDLHFVLLSNGNQVRRFLMFVDENRLLDTRAKFVLLYDHRVLAPDMVNIWRNILHSIFIRWKNVAQSNVVVEKRILNKPTEYLDVYLEELNLLLTEILYSTQVHRCYAIITDNIHYTAFGSTFFERSLKSYSNFFLRISDFEDLMAPNFQTVRVLKEIRAQNCDLHFVLLSNGNQVRRFLMFVDENRLLDTRAKFVLLYDHRVLAPDMVNIWRNILHSIFIRWKNVAQSNVVVEKRILNKPTEYLDVYLEELNLLLTEILYSTQVHRCYAIITDNIHYTAFGSTFFERSQKSYSNFFLRISDFEDLMAPNFQTVRVLKEIRAQNCDLHFVLLSNGNQVRRFLMFVDENRLLDTRAKFVLLYDHRVLAPDMVNIWRNILHSIFIRWKNVAQSNVVVEKREFTLVSIPYPNILNGVLSTQEILRWKNQRFNKKNALFPDKTKDFKAAVLRAVAFKHIPMVMKNKTGDYAGVEVEIMRSLEKAMNFKIYFYETNDSNTEQWGRTLPNRSFTGLIGEMVNRKAKFAIGDLQLNILHSTVMDMSNPHTHDCLTFLTPESSKDNSWKTLILPFSGDVWAAVIGAQLIVGTVFYVMSYTHSVNITGSTHRKQNFFSIFKKRRFTIDTQRFRDIKFRSSLNRRMACQEPTDLFDDYSNCILLTYSMSLFVSLPRMPKNWPLRVLTGWYWIYCIMLVVFYRASFTAILANPAPRITIDTIEELSKSQITASVWGTENKKFFEEAFDEIAQEISEKLELVDDIYGVTDRIAKGSFAYYDNQYFLRHLRQLGSQRREDTEILHIMKECVVNMPISIGMEKNSPLKPNVDKYLSWMKETGLLSKWLKDATKDLPSEEMAPQEALMNIQKFWSSFVALGFGYILGILTIGSEVIYFKYIVERHPLYDKYNPRMYYNFQRRFNH